RPLPIDRQIKMREVARITVEQALRAAGPGKRIAVAIEEGKGVAMLQGARSSLLQRGGRRDEELCHRRDWLYRCDGWPAIHRSDRHVTVLLCHDLKIQLLTIGAA